MNSLPIPDDLAAAVEQQMQLFEAENGFRPDLTFTVEPIIKVSFDMKGFAHEGRSFRNKTADHIAKEAFREIAEHRQTCVRCGEGKLSLSWKLYYLKYRLLRDGRFGFPADARYSDWHCVHTNYIRIEPGRFEKEEFEITIEDVLSEPSVTEIRLMSGRYRTWRRMAKELRQRLANEASSDAPSNVA